MIDLHIKKPDGSAEKIPIDDDTLMVFVDEVGDEEFRGNQPYFGFGGCAFKAGDYSSLIRFPWERLRVLHAGSTTSPLHAVTFNRTASQKSRERMARFFRRPFYRFGAFVTTRTVMPESLTALRLVLKALQERIRQVFARTDCTKIVVIFERSSRIEALTKLHFADFGLEENGKEIPIELGLMDKTAHEPALEIADFVANTVGEQARRSLAGKVGFGRSFTGTFHDVPGSFTSYIAIESAGIGDPPDPPASRMLEKLPL